jgi:hypothetical protein
MGADVVIAVDLDWERPLPDPSPEHDPNNREIANASIALLRRHLAAQDDRYADVVVKPSFGREVRWDGFLDPDDLIEAGREAMRAQMDAVDARIAAVRSSRRARTTTNVPG